MRRCAACIVLMVLLAFPASAQFEGVVETKNLTTDELGSLQQFTMTMWIQKDRIRVRNSAFGSTPATTMIYRGDMHRIWVLNEDDKTYFEILQEGPDEGTRSDPLCRSADEPVLRRSGRTKKILGYNCEQVLLSREEGETEIWGTKELADLAVTTSRVIGQMDAGEWMGGMESLGLYPLVSSTRMDGRLIESQETTRVQAQDLATDLFTLPAGYRKQAVGDMQGPPH